MTRFPKSRVVRKLLFESAFPTKATAAFAMVAFLSVGELAASNLLTNAGFELGNFNT